MKTHCDRFRLICRVGLFAAALWVAGANFTQAAMSSAWSGYFTIDTGGIWDSAWSGYFTINTLGVGDSVNMSSAYSPYFGVDTRGQDGTLSGVVKLLGTEAPVSGAEITLEGTEARTLTAGDGAFQLTAVRQCDGYVLSISAPNLQRYRMEDMKMPSAMLDLGTIYIPPCAVNNVRVVRLVPDVNPPGLEVGTGGTGYWYYQMLGKGVLDGKTYPAVSQTVELRRRDGTVIPQTGVLAANMPGYRAGVSDSRGIVRLEVPAAYMPSMMTYLFDVYYQGLPVQSFGLARTARAIDKYAKHKIGGGVSGRLTEGNLELKGSTETKIKHAFVDGILAKETYSLQRTAELKVGLEHSTVPGGKLGLVEVGAKVGGGAYLKVGMAGEYIFPVADVTDEQKAIKFYLLAGDSMAAVAHVNQPVEFIYNALRGYYEGRIASDYLNKVKLAGELGGYANSHIGGYIGLGSTKSFNIGVFAKSSIQAGILFNREDYMDQSMLLEAGFKAESSVNGNIGVLLGDMGKRADGKDGKYPFPDIGCGGQWSGEGSLTAGLTKKNTSDSMPNTIFIKTTLKNSEGAAIDIPILGKIIKEGSAGGNASLAQGAETTYSVNVPNQTVWLALLQQSLFGKGLTNQMPEISMDSLGGFLVGIAQMAVDNQLFFGYESKVSAEDEWEIELGAELDLTSAVGKLGISVCGGMARGIEGVVQKGRVRGISFFPNVVYAPVDENELPTKDTLAYAAEYLPYAWAAVVNLVQQAAEDIVAAQQAVQAAVGSLTQNGAAAAVEFLGGAQSAGGQFIVSLLPGFSGAGAGARRSLRAGSADYLPPDGASNYVYGLGGFYMLAVSNNQMMGAGTLKIQYDDAVVAGLVEADLAVYHYSDDSNAWSLCASAACPESNLVSCVVSQMGIYAMAPPLPAGILTATMATGVLDAARGTPTDVRFANIPLNNGLPATQAWMFTVSADGLEILGADVNTNRPGMQLAASNAVLTVRVLPNRSASDGALEVASAAGNARGWVSFTITDTNLPPVIAAGNAVAGQSRVNVSWAPGDTNLVSHYRVYWRVGQAGPPYDGVALSDGQNSPFDVLGTNTVLTGLQKGSNYYVAVAAVSHAGLTGPLLALAPVTTSEQPPAPPSFVSMQCQRSGTNTVVWTLSEDDGFNDRDVVRYNVYRAICPYGTYAKIGEVTSGVNVFCENSPSISATQFVRYAVISVDSQSYTSALFIATQQLADGGGADNDGDKIGDVWETARGLNPENPADGLLDSDGDGFNNLVEYQADTDPLDSNSLPRMSIDGTGTGLELQWLGGSEVRHTLEYRDALTSSEAWQELSSFAPPNMQTNILSVPHTNNHRFFRLKLAR